MHAFYREGEGERDEQQTCGFAGSGVRTPRGKARFEYNGRLDERLGKGARTLNVLEATYVQT